LNLAERLILHACAAYCLIDAGLALADWLHRRRRRALMRERIEHYHDQ
jgi:hypothetical protein